VTNHDENVARRWFRLAVGRFTQPLDWNTVAVYCILYSKLVVADGELARGGTRVQRAQYKRDLTLLQFASRDLVFLCMFILIMCTVTFITLVTIDHNNRSKPTISVRCWLRHTRFSVAPCQTRRVPIRNTRVSVHRLSRGGVTRGGADGRRVHLQRRHRDQLPTAVSAPLPASVATVATVAAVAAAGTTRAAPATGRTQQRDGVATTTLHRNDGWLQRHRRYRQHRRLAEVARGGYSIMWSVMSTRLLICASVNSSRAHKRTQNDESGAGNRGGTEDAGLN
jgi:hypothetical protein